MFLPRLRKHGRLFSLLLMGVALVFLCALAGIAADISPEMLTAARDGKLDDIKELLAKGEDANAANADGVTALMVAATENRLTIVRVLLDAGADARMKTASGKTAAFFASGKGNTEVASILEAAASKPPVAPEVSLDAWRDPNTGLMWAKKDNASDVNQPQALNYCRNLSLGGFRDWRLPEIDELQHVYDPSVVSGKYSFSDGKTSDLHVKGSIQITGCCSWSATSGTSSGQAWSFLFFDGSRGSADAGHSFIQRALCVRRPGE